jgi:amidophosphoribosyltransferase
MCGVFGIYGHEEAANLTYLGLHALQHRGQESAGIVTNSEERMHQQVRMGLVSDGFKASTLEKLPGRSAIGHVRYSTSGQSEIRNAQPFLFEYTHGSVSLAHNGNLVNAGALRKRLETSGSIFQTNSDTEVLVHLMAQAQEPESIERIAAALRQVTGAYSLLILTETKLIAVRDPHGFRPLSMGKLKDAIVFSSETCAFGLIEAEFERELEPGEVVVCEGKSVRSYRPLESTRGRLGERACVFEHVYFSRPDSDVNGRSIYKSRVRLGRRLAKESMVEGDVVIAVPDSGVPAAIGFAEESGLPFATGLIRSHYVGRTFIEPQDSIRHFGVRLKLSPVRSVVEGKRVIVVDDSLVRGTTSRKIVAMLKASGAKEVHMRISAPPTTHSCFYGLDTPTRSELIASSNSVEEIRAYVDCTSLAYLSHEGLMESLDSQGGDDSGFCSACFTGEYPVAVPGGSTDNLVSIKKAKNARAQ